ANTRERARKKANRERLTFIYWWRVVYPAEKRLPSLRARERGHGGSRGDTRQSIAQPAEPHALLLQTQPGLVAIESEVVIDRRLLGRATRQVVAHRVGLLAPVQAVGKESLTVHEEGRRVRKV